MTRREEIEARLRAALENAPTHSIGKPSIEELENALAQKDVEVEVRPSGEVVIRSSIEVHPADLRWLLNEVTRLEKELHTEACQQRIEWQET